MADKNARSTARSSPLQRKLEKIVHDHPGVELHPGSPSGRPVRAAKFHIPAEEIVGQIIYDTDVTPHRWVVRAYYEPVKDSLVIENPATEADLSDSITRVCMQVLLLAYAGPLMNALGTPEN